MVCLICKSLYSSFAKLLQNSLPLSDTNSKGVPKRQIHFSKICFATVSASLLSMAIISAYFVKASVMQSTNFFPFWLTLSGPKRSKWTL